MWFEIAEDGEWKLDAVAILPPYSHLSVTPYPEYAPGDGDAVKLAIDEKPAPMTGRCKGKEILLHQAWDETDPRAFMDRTRVLTLRVNGKVKQKSKGTSKEKVYTTYDLHYDPETSAFTELMQSIAALQLRL